MIRGIHNLQKMIARDQQRNQISGYSLSPTCRLSLIWIMRFGHFLVMDRPPILSMMLPIGKKMKVCAPTKFGTTLP